MAEAPLAMKRLIDRHVGALVITIIERRWKKLFSRLPPAAFEFS